ncbi:MAG: M48 family metalloprotease [Desulfatiglandaceae bacterium]|jgi:Zn-dependent protease with chaperone function
MFNHIIYFIVVLLTFSVSYAGKAPGYPLPLTLVAIGIGWAGFALYCRKVFEGISNHFRGKGFGDGRAVALYQKAQVRLSVLAIFIFALFTFLLNLKYWIQAIPGFKSLTVLQGLVALALYLFFLFTIWWFAAPTYRELFSINITRKSYIFSNARLNVPILFPWVCLSLIYDLLALSPWGQPSSFFNTMEGQILFFSIFLVLLMIVLPVFIQSWWGCRPLDDSDKSRQLMAFLEEKGFKYRYLLRWPLFEGRMMTAGIMGILPRFRYILVTDSLLEILSIDELKAVLAHEMGHAKYRHLLYYVLFLIGYLVLTFGLFDIYYWLLASSSFFSGFLASGHEDGNTLMYMVLSLPMLLSLVIYFRYVMGFFMRNFERQADLYSAKVMGTPEYTIRSLEKIAMLSGRSRNVPSWHHFSIRERVDCLARSLRDPTLLKRHTRFVTVLFTGFIVLVVFLGYLLNFSPLKEHMTYAALENVLQEQLSVNPADLGLYENLAMLYQKMEDYGKAIEVYEKILRLDPDRSLTLNNLAWLLVTSDDPKLRDRRRALALAKRAVSLERIPVYLDTLAEAYYENGDQQEALETIREALSRARKNRTYYEKQLRKFLSGDLKKS